MIEVLHEKPISHDMVLQAKIHDACRIIEAVFEHYEKPCFLCSFGKDSMLLLFMLREWFTDEIPLVHFRQPYFRRKQAFAERMGAELEMEVHSNIPPIGISITSKNGKSELVQHFAIGKKHLTMPLGRQKIEGRPKWLCGTETFLKGPFGAFAWPWDAAFCGHKSSDSDPVQGDVPLNVDVHQIEASCHLAYPLRNFTDADVWTLTKKWGIEVNRLRYGTEEEPNMDTENFFNDDYFPYCMKCMDPLEERFVVCPKTGLTITNISDSIPQLDPKLAYCT
jgi:hypothetical protein